jgi:hypothetical protein
VFILRLFLDAIAAGLWLFAMAYDWLGNTAHEIAGTLIVLLLISHNTFNRKWYGRLKDSLWPPHSMFPKTVTLSLLVVVVILAVTSLLISRSVFAFLGLKASFSVSQVHALAAYLGLTIASLHVGLQWSMIMRVFRNWFGVIHESKIRRYVLRLTAALIAAYGLRGFYVVDVKSKLLMQININYWDFEKAAMEFMSYHIAMFSLGISISHYSRSGLYKLMRSDRATQI